MVASFAQSSNVGLHCDVDGDMRFGDELLHE